MTDGDATWPDGPGVLVLPSGRRVRGRGLRAAGGSAADPPPTFGVYLLDKPPAPSAWESVHIPWPDFRLPRDRAFARAVLTDAYARTAGERVEVACRGGRGRTGTALACLAILDGVDPDDAVAYVRRHYRSGAVETPGQKRFVRAFRA